MDSSTLDRICQQGTMCYKKAHDGSGIGMGVPTENYTRAEVIKAAKLALKVK